MGGSGLARCSVWGVNAAGSTPLPAPLHPAHRPDCYGVASSATIVSHYTRRGDYRVHAAAVGASGAGLNFKHTFLKGARERPGEDEACALLTLRALADITERPGSHELEDLGVITTPTTTALSNAVGETVPLGSTETIPVRTPSAPSEFVSGARVLIPKPDSNRFASTVAPSKLPGQCACPPRPPPPSHRCRQPRHTLSPPRPSNSPLEQPPARPQSTPFPTDTP